MYPYGFGFGLVLSAAKLILRFADRHYRKNKADYSAEQQQLIESLFAAADAITGGFPPVVGP